MSRIRQCIKAVSRSWETAFFAFERRMRMRPENFRDGDGSDAGRGMTVRKNWDWSLYLVTDRRWLGAGTLRDAVEGAVSGGAGVVQLREKELSSRAFLETAGELKRLTDRYGIPLIVNDRIDIALAAGADGVHLGPDDLPVGIARKLLGEGRVIGASAATLDEALRLQAEGADYLGVGAVFPTATKQDADQVSLEALGRIKASVRIPVVAIGGITAANAQAVMETGVDGVAVVSAIMAAPDAYDEARRFKALLKEARR
jgi:thiamine-phosphate pyrophosphorylase